jgi:hypothetical protein
MENLKKISDTRSSINNLIRKIGNLLIPTISKHSMIYCPYQGGYIDNVHLGLGDILTLYMNPPSFGIKKDVDKYHVFSPTN